jgi:hypothetical protein
VALSEAEAFEEWVHREDPPYSLVVSVKEWIDRLEDAPWQAPSSQIDEMTVLGEYQTRQATVQGIDVIYQEDFLTGRTDLIHVGSRPDLLP